jgi:DNA-binding transcriptional MerR regulator
MTASGTAGERYLGISEVAEATGLSPDTLRWYEREGLVPPVDRDGSRRRRYSPRHVGWLRTLVLLRRTGMPTRDMRRFGRLAADGRATHGERLALLAAHRERIVARIAELTDDLGALDAKVERYRWLIEHGRDCAGTPTDPGTPLVPPRG